MCILFVYTLLTVVRYYDLSVLSMSLIGFPKKLDREWGGWGALYPVLFWNLFNFAKPLKEGTMGHRSMEVLELTLPWTMREMTMYFL